MKVNKLGKFLESWIKIDIYNVDLCIIRMMEYCYLVIRFKGSDLYVLTERNYKNIC